MSIEYVFGSSSHVLRAILAKKKEKETYFEAIKKELRTKE